MAIKDARKRQSSAKDLNSRNAKRVAHGRPASPRRPRPALATPEIDSTRPESEQPDSQGFYHTIVVRLPSNRSVPVEPDPRTRPQLTLQSATASRLVSTTSGKPSTGKRKLSAVPKSSDSCLALPDTGITRGRPAAKKAKVSRGRSLTVSTRNRRRSTSSSVKDAAPLRARSFTVDDVSMIPLIDGEHADISSPSSSSQSTRDLDLLLSIPTRDHAFRFLQQNSPAPILSLPLSWVQDTSISSPLTNAYHLLAPSHNNLIRNINLGGLSQQCAPGLKSSPLSSTQAVSSPLAQGYHAATPGPNRSTCSCSSTRLSEQNVSALVSSPLSSVQKVSSPLTNAYNPPNPCPNRSTSTASTSPTPQPLQIVLATASVSPPPAPAQDTTSPLSIAQAPSLRGLSATMQSSVGSWDVPHVAVSGVATVDILADRETQTLCNDERDMEMSSSGASDADTSSPNSEDETKPEPPEVEIDIKAMLTKLAAGNPSLAKLLTASGPRSGRGSQRRNGFVQDITGRMKKITEGSRYAWPEEKMPVKVNLVNSLTRNTERTAEDEEGRRVPGLFHSVSFEEKWEVSAERDNFDLPSVKQRRGHGLAKRMMESACDLQDDHMGSYEDCTDGILDTIIARMPPSKLK
ncbi:hypothetical protein EV426DRAFT_678093 [Tirmania nivea]|nr:hypothetical protein EV426DRAFT_678093 [Tirmania nivea]